MAMYGYVGLCRVMFGYAEQFGLCSIVLGIVILFIIYILRNTHQKAMS